MCSHLKTTRRKKVTVYKVVALKKNGRRDIMYSPITGMEYKIGEVPIIKRLKKRAVCFGIVYSPKNVNYRKLMVGKTSGFRTLKNAKTFLNLWRRNLIISREVNSSGFELKFAKLVLLGDIIEGEYMDFPIFAGSYIYSIELI